MKQRPAGNHQDFVVRPFTAGGWDLIAGALARLFVRLADSGAGHCVVVQSTTDRYVQYMVQPDGAIWSEAVGDVNLAEPYCDEQQRLLAHLGWHEPCADGRFASNYFHEWRAGEELAAATVGVLTMMDVFGAGPFDAVRVCVHEAVGRP